MTDVFRVADILIIHAVASHGDELDLIGYYGSYAQGAATARSDLDIFYIPREGQNPPVNRCILVGGLLFDFWPITWETMAGFATGRLRGWACMPSLVYYAQVLWSRSEEATARLEDLKQQVVSLQQPEARPEMVRRALDKFGTVLTHLGTLRLAAASGDLTDTRDAAWRVVTGVIECLALVNQTFFDRGLNATLQQLASLPARPADLEALITTLATSPDAATLTAAAETLALETRRVLREAQASLPARSMVSDQFGSAYPEMNGAFAKVLSACDQGQEVAARWAAWGVQGGVAEMLATLRPGAGDHPDFNLYSEGAELYQEIGLPDLLALPPSDLQALTEQVSLLDTRVRAWLGEQSVDLQEFATVEAFERSLAPNR